MDDKSKDIKLIVGYYSGPSRLFDGLGTEIENAEDNIEMDAESRRDYT